MAVLAITDIGINLPVLLAQTVNFIVLLVLLRLVAYKPILKMLDERKARIQEGLSAAERGKESAAEAEKESAAALEAARREGQTIVQNAQQASQRLQEEGRVEAVRQQEAILERARAEIAQERDAAISELRREFAELTIAAAEKIIGQSLDRNAHQRLIEQALAESSFREN
jgi:F-type H+-transporting ATPase subunit b